MDWLFLPEWALFPIMMAGIVCVCYLLDRYFDRPCRYCGGKVDYVLPVEEGRSPYFQCRRCRRLQ